MADESAVEFDTATGSDYRDHLQMYENFIHLTKYSALAIIVVLILMAIFLA
jgi:hypothetical protein